MISSFDIVAVVLLMQTSMVLVFNIIKVLVPLQEVSLVQEQDLPFVLEFREVPIRPPL